MKNIEEIKNRGYNWVIDELKMGTTMPEIKKTVSVDPEDHFDVGVKRAIRMYDVGLL